MYLKTIGGYYYRKINRNNKTMNCTNNGVKTEKTNTYFR